ncbi:MAG: hypothetical protein GY804_04250 [Alphaproteobacteria bacterium]|nr:hypothetical protein [Alphaproteobacteria bacterium]
MTEILLSCVVVLLVMVLFNQKTLAHNQHMLQEGQKVINRRLKEINN